MPRNTVPLHNMRPQLTVECSVPDHLNSHMQIRMKKKLAEQKYRKYERMSFLRHFAPELPTEEWPRQKKSLQITLSQHDFFAPSKPRTNSPTLSLKMSTLR